MDTPHHTEDTMELIAGKRYRWTVEGTADDYGLTLPSGGLLTGGTLTDGKAELLPEPLPTTPGSVIRSNYVYMLTSKGWVSQSGSFYPQYTSGDHGFTVLFDAGADRA